MTRDIKSIMTVGMLLYTILVFRLSTLLKLARVNGKSQGVGHDVLELKTAVGKTDDANGSVVGLVHPFVYSALIGSKNILA